VFHAKSGQTVTVTIRRHGATKHLSMTLGVQPTSPSS
jgi:S1-C subfamily serine protease